MIDIAHNCGAADSFWNVRHFDIVGYCHVPQAVRLYMVYKLDRIRLILFILLSRDTPH